MVVLSRSLLGMPMAGPGQAYPSAEELRSAKTRKLRSTPDKLRSDEFTALDAARLEAVVEAAARLRAYYERAAESSTSPSSGASRSMGSSSGRCGQAPRRAHGCQLADEPHAGEPLGPIWRAPASGGRRGGGGRRGSR